jgi:cysteine desulfurase family protein
MNHMIYLDNAATSYYKPKCVLETLAYHSKNSSANAGRGGHELAIQASSLIMEAREAAADYFGISDPLRIAFGQNTTMALNIGISGLIKEGDHVIISSMEHNSVSRTVAAKDNVEYTVVMANTQGYLNPLDVERAIRPNTALIVINHASNVTGSVQDIDAIGRIAKKYEIPFMVDAAQSAGCIPIDVERMNISLLAFAGHKCLMGPLGTGGLYVREDVPIRPILFGGTGSMSESLSMPDFLPDALEAGTVNAPAFAALASGIRFVQKHQAEIKEKEAFLTERLLQGLLNIDSVTLYGNPFLQNRVGVVSFTIDGRDPTECSNRLSEKHHIAVRAGLHCATLAHQTIGTIQGGTIRASVGYFNKVSDIDALLLAVKRFSR